MRRFAALFILVAVYTLQMTMACAAAEPVTDIRVLVDVSGSMRQTDPNNLRRPALKLLFGLSPETARVGMWSFAKFTNMQLKPEFATRARKEEARKAADTVHSRGQRTNIEEVLRRSTWDWEHADSNWSRHMILLTDGMVDVSRDPSENNASRKRILEDIIPRLKAGGVRVHTVALSAQADHALLQELSRKTDGWYERVEGSEGLQRIFLRMFEKASPGDTLPIKENRFSIDKSITDMTLLVFRKNGAAATQIRQPDGAIIDSKMKAGNIEWHEEQDYDLLTVKEPAAGAWSIIADADPDNRVRVLTNLRLVTKELPNNILLGESFTVHAILQENNSIVNDEKFLGVVDFTAGAANSQAGIDYRYTLLADRSDQAAKGAYSRNIDDLPEPGIYELSVIAHGETFARSKRLTIKLHELPVLTEVKEKGDLLEITAEAVKGLFTAGSMKLAVVLPGSNAAPQWMTEVGENKWVYTTDKLYPGEEAGIIINGVLENKLPYEHMIDISLPGEKPFTPIKPVNFYIEPVTVLNPELQVIKEKEQVIKEKPVVNEELKEGKPPEPIVAIDEQPASKGDSETPADKRREETNWWFVGGLIVFLNVAAIAASVFAYKYWTRKSVRVDLVLGDDDGPGTGEQGDKNAIANSAAEESVHDDHSGELSGAVAAALEGMELPEEKREPGEDFSALRRDEVVMPPVVLDEGDIPEFEVEESVKESAEVADGAASNDTDVITKPE